MGRTLRENKIDILIVCEVLLFLGRSKAKRIWTVLSFIKEGVNGSRNHGTDMIRSFDLCKILAYVIQERL